MAESKALPQLHCNQCSPEVDEESARIIGKAILVSPVSDGDEENEDTQHFLFHLNCFKVWLDEIMKQEERLYMFEVSIAPVGDIAAGLFTSSDDEL